MPVKQSQLVFVDVAFPLWILPGHRILSLNEFGRASPAMRWIEVAVLNSGLKETPNRQQAPCISYLPAAFLHSIPFQSSSGTREANKRRAVAEQLFLLHCYCRQLFESAGGGTQGKTSAMWLSLPFPFFKRLAWQ